MKLDTSMTCLGVLQLQLLYWLVLGTEANQDQFTIFTQIKCDDSAVCAVSQPNKSISVVSKGQCALHCQNKREKPESCIGVNYREQDNTCDVFYYEDIRFRKNVTGCQYIQKGRIDTLTCTNIFLPRDCADILELGSTPNGAYTVYLTGKISQPLSVYCDMTTASVGWTVFQRRLDGSVDFNLTWTYYQIGFGDIRGEFWIGNENLYLLTSVKRYKLRVDLTDFNGATAYAEYDNFKVESAADKYRLSSIGTYSGTAKESLSFHLGSQFTTLDQDNDSYGTNCAVDLKGGWWFKNCHVCNLNGHYYSSAVLNIDGVIWHRWKYSYESMKRAEMKITPYV